MIITWQEKPVLQSTLNMEGKVAMCRSNHPNTKRELQCPTLLKKIFIIFTETNFSKMWKPNGDASGPGQ